MSTVVETRLAVSLEVECCPEAERTGGPLWKQLHDGSYDLCSVLACPQELTQWRGEHGTARKRADRAKGRGYCATELRREFFAPDIFDINTSAERRQGRPMSAGYLMMPNDPPLPDYPCARHAIRTTGVWSNEGTLVAYLVMIRAGQLALVSQILGHASHLKNEVMFLLFQHALEREVDADPDCFVVYNRWDSGATNAEGLNGLRWHKERLGFQEMAVEWLP